MGLFDKMFGRGASAVAEQPKAQKRFGVLKQKFQPVLKAVEQQSVQLLNLHVEGDKLFLRGVAPSDKAKNVVWNEIKILDPDLKEITAEITVRASAAPSTVAVPAAPRTPQTHTVKPGDSLSKISKQYYGDSDEYMRIFYANREKIDDPDLIFPGQQLVIPPDDND